MDGFGKLVWNDGVEYIGQFKEDKFHGQGTYKWKDDKIYIGGWLNGEQHGEGKLISGNKMKVGKWENGERVGNWINVTDNPYNNFSDIESQLNGTLNSQGVSGTLRSQTLISQRF